MADRVSFEILVIFASDLDANLTAPQISKILRRDYRYVWESLNRLRVQGFVERIEGDRRTPDRYIAGQRIVDLLEAQKRESTNRV